MGNVAGRLARHDRHQIDGGRLYAIGDEEQEYNRQVTARLIGERKLAPFYPDSFLIDPGGSKQSAGKKRRRLLRMLGRTKVEQNNQILLDARWFTEDLVDCPICMTRYPRNINRTCCCRQAICTSCFVHLRRPPSGRPISCPFCNAANFSVRYDSPTMILAGEKAEEARNTKSQGDAEEIKVGRALSAASLRPSAQGPRPGGNFYMASTGSTTSRAASSLQQQRPGWSGTRYTYYQGSVYRPSGSRYLYPHNSNPYRPPSRSPMGSINRQSPFG